MSSALPAAPIRFAIGALADLGPIIAGHARPTVTIEAASIANA
jgi:hypothetical protein